MNYSILRGRFQPFSRLHYDCIRGFYEEFVKEVDESQWPWLVLCIVRDHETLLSRHGLLKKHIPGPYLRHLSIFNPLSIAFCEYYIREGLQYFSRHDPNRDTLQPESFQRFLGERMIIQAVPLKLTHILESLKHNGNSTVEEIMELLGKKPKLPSQDVRMLLRLLPIIAFETLAFPGNNNLAWFLPVLDREDLKDNEEIKKHNHDVRLKYHPHVATYLDLSEEHQVFFRPRLRPFDEIGFISHYGVFIYFSYLNFAQKTTKLDVEAVGNEIKAVREFIEKLLTPTCFSDYLHRIEEITQNLEMDKMPKEEKRLLEDPSEFVLQSCRYLMVPDRDEFSRLKIEGSELGIVTIQDIRILECFSGAELEVALEKLNSWRALPGDVGDRSRQLIDLLNQTRIVLQREPEKPIPSRTKQLWFTAMEAMRQNEPHRIDEELFKCMRLFLQ